MYENRKKSIRQLSSTFWYIPPGLFFLSIFFNVSDLSGMFSVTQVVLIKNNQL